MDRSAIRCFFSWFSGLAAFALLAAGSSPSRGEEPFQQFLDGLRERNYFDAAMMYLEEMRGSNLVTPDIKILIPYEEGRTRIDDARVEKDPTQKNRKLQEAEEKLNGFVTANSAHPMTPAARMQLGNVIVERGRMAADSATRPQNQGNKAALEKQARDLFDSAFKVFDDAEKNFKEILDKFPRFIPDTDKEQIARRTVARRDFIQAQLLSAAVMYEKAKTYADKSPDAKKFLQQAADKYEKTYQDFRTILAGQLARIKQGQCYQDMGDTRRALGLYADILGQPDDIPEFRKLKASALYLSMQCWLADSEKKYELAALKGDEWLVTARGIEDRQADWLAIRYYTALAKVAHAKELAGDGKDKTKVATADKLRRVARDFALRVSKIDGPYQEPAKALLKDIGGAVASDKEPTTFVEAVEKGTIELNMISEVNGKIKIAPELGKEEVAKIPEYQKEALAHRASALGYFALALNLREADTPKDELNNVRYYISFLRYQEQKYYDAAVMGEFVMRNYPDSAGARSCAKIALASYLQELNAPSNADQAQELRDFDYNKMIEIADYCGKRWPEEPETQDNWAIVMAVSVGRHDMPRAVEFLKRIPETSARRAESELKMGQAYWGEFLTAVNKEASQRPPQAELDNLVKEAQTWLESGMSRMRADVDKGTSAVTIELVAAALSTAQIYVQSGQNEKSLALLEEKAFGPLTLVEKKNPLVIAGASAIPMETLKVALRTYIGLSASNPKAIDRAEEIMKSLDELAKAKGGDNSLMSIYISMGQALEKQIQEYKAQNKNTDSLTLGFETFLNKISKDSSDFAPLNWVAGTYYSLGAGFDAAGAALPEKAKAYFAKSRTADDKLLEMIAKDRAAAEKKVIEARRVVESARAKARTKAGQEEFKKAEEAMAEPLAELDKVDNMMLAVQLRTAKSYRRLNEYEKAIDTLESVLLKKNQLLEAQFEAAETYMDWGEAVNPLYYNLAALGARKPKEGPANALKTIWGWARISNTLYNDKKYEDQYHLARINLARCHFQQAMHSDAAKNNLNKTELLKLASEDIRLTTRLKEVTADKVKPEIFAQYDEVLKLIQKARGEKAVGLKAFESPKPTAPTGKAPVVGGGN